MHAKVIASSSKGNMFKVDDKLVIDLGVTYKLAKEELENVEYVLLTHQHADHCNKTTIRKVHVNYPNIIFVGCEWMIELLTNMNVDKKNLMQVEIGKVYKLNNYTISPIKAYHDVSNCGYRIKKGFEYLLHITDTYTLEGIKALSYDTGIIECNYDENTIDNVIQQDIEEKGFSHLQGAMNSHLSVQETLDFVTKNNIKQLIPVHIGSSTKAGVLKELRKYNEKTT